VNLARERGIQGRLDELAAKLRADYDLAGRTVDYLQGQGEAMAEAKQNGLMTAQEVADFLQVTLRWVYRLHKERGLPLFKLGGRVWRCKVEDLDAWLEEQKTASSEQGQG